MAVRPPIVIDENGDVTAYGSLEEAQAAVEAIDVLNNEYRFFDSTGLVLQGEVSQPSGGASWISRVLRPQVPSVRLVEDPRGAIQPDELANTLRTYLSRAQASVSTGELDRAPLATLVVMTLRLSR